MYWVSGWLCELVPAGGSQCVMGWVRALFSEVQHSLNWRSCGWDHLSRVEMPTTLSETVFSKHLRGISKVPQSEPLSPTRLVTAPEKIKPKDPGFSVWTLRLEPHLRVLATAWQPLLVNHPHLVSLLSFPNLYCLTPHPHIVLVFGFPSAYFS